MLLPFFKIGKLRQYFYSVNGNIIFCKKTTNQSKPTCTETACGSSGKRKQPGRLSKCNVKPCVRFLVSICWKTQRRAASWLPREGDAPFSGGSPPAASGRFHRPPSSCACWCHLNCPARRLYAETLYFLVIHSACLAHTHSALGYCQGPDTIYHSKQVYYTCIQSKVYDTAALS